MRSRSAWESCSADRNLRRRPGRRSGRLAGRRGLDRRGHRHRARHRPAGRGMRTRRARHPDRARIPRPLPPRCSHAGDLVAAVTTPRRCYACDGTGRRGPRECEVCAGTGALTGPYVRPARTRTCAAHRATNTAACTSSPSSRSARATGRGAKTEPGLKHRERHLTVRPLRAPDARARRSRKAARAGAGKPKAACRNPPTGGPRRFPHQLPGDRRLRRFDRSGSAQAPT